MTARRSLAAAALALSISLSLSSCKLAPEPDAASGWSGIDAPISDSPTACHDFAVAPDGSIYAAFAAYQDGQRLTVIRRDGGRDAAGDSVLGSRGFSERLVSQVKIALDGLVPCVAWLEADALTISADAAGERPEPDRLVYERFEAGAWRKAAVVERGASLHFRGYDIIGGEVYVGLLSDVELPARSVYDRFAVKEASADGTVRDLGALVPDVAAHPEHLIDGSTRFCRFFAPGTQLFVFWYGPDSSVLYNETILVACQACADPSVAAPAWHSPLFAQEGYLNNYVPVFFDGSKAVSFGIDRSSESLEFPTRSYIAPDFSASDSSRPRMRMDGGSMDGFEFFAAASDGGRGFVAASDGTCPNPYLPGLFGGSQDPRYDLDHHYNTGRVSVFESVGGGLEALGTRGFSGGGARDCSLKIANGAIYASYVDAAYKYGLVVAHRGL